MLEAPPSAAHTPLAADHTAPENLWPDREEWAEALGPAVDLALNYLATAAAEPVNRPVFPSEMAPRFDLNLPEVGCNPGEAVQEWMERAGPGIVRSAGPRYFGFVTGGSTPAAIAGEHASLSKGSEWKVDYHVVGMCAEAIRLSDYSETVG